MGNRIKIFEHGEQTGEIDLENSEAVYEGENWYIEAVCEDVNDGYTQRKHLPREADSAVAPSGRVLLTGDALRRKIEPFLKGEDDIEYETITD